MSGSFAAASVMERFVLPNTFLGPPPGRGQRAGRGHWIPQPMPNTMRATADTTHFRVEGMTRVFEGETLR